MGLVHIHGKAQGEKLVNSPITQTPCYFYKVDVETYESDFRGSSWRHSRTDKNGARFYLEDATGNVLIDAWTAEYDLMETCKREAGGSQDRGEMTTLFGNQGYQASAAGPQITEPSLVAYSKSGSSLGGSMLGVSDGGLILSGDGGMASSDRLRYTEYCILKDHPYDVTGTCGQNANPKDEHDRNMITKGENEPTFLISWRNEKVVEKELRRRAIHYILGGASLPVACLGFLLIRFGWI